MITRTIHSMMIQNSGIIQDSVSKPIPYSTLNEKYDLRIPYDDTLPPKIGWYGVGINYHSLINDDEADIKDYVHSISDFDTFLPLPFIARDKSIGLTSAELSRYTMIVEKEIDDVIYQLCYLKRIDAIDTTTKVSELERDEDGIYNTVDFIQDIKPKPKLSSDDSNRFMICSNNALLKITVSDMERMKKASDLLYPNIDEDERYTLSEVALFSGIELDNGVERLQASFFKYIELDLDSDKDYSTRLSIGSMSPKVKL